MTDPKLILRAGHGGHAGYWNGERFVVSVSHKPDCAWEPEIEHCTCGALVLAKAYRFAHGGVIAFDQFGHQMPYYQQWAGVGEARIRRDWPAVDIRPGDVIP